MEGNYTFHSRPSLWHTVLGSGETYLKLVIFSLLQITWRETIHVALTRLRIEWIETHLWTKIFFSLRTKWKEIIKKSSALVIHRHVQRWSESKRIYKHAYFFLRTKWKEIKKRLCSCHSPSRGAGVNEPKRIYKPAYFSFSVHQVYFYSFSLWRVQVTRPGRKPETHRATQVHTSRLASLPTPARHPETRGHSRQGRNTVCVTRGELNL